MPPADDFASRPSSSKGSSSTRSNKPPLLSYLVPFPIPPEPVDDPLPFPFDIFFTIVEPALTIGGAIWAWFGPVNYHESLIPETVVPKPSTMGVDPHTSTVMAVRQLGNCELHDIFLPSWTKVRPGCKLIIDVRLSVQVTAC